MEMLAENDVAALDEQEDVSAREVELARRRGQARRDFLHGQLEGNMVNIRLHHALAQPGSIDPASLLPSLEAQSIHYRSGLKSVVFEKTFPLAIQLFHATRRSRRERIQLMDEILALLR